MTATTEISPEIFHERTAAIEREVARVVVGQQEILRHVLICMLASRHALLEGVPGLGKTLLIRTLAAALQLNFSRIQFTPDLMPSDIIGTDILEETEEGRRAFRFQHGPIFANLILADEINRATPKTQSALLEAMQEKTVTVAGRRYALEAPFFVLATQNPLEMEGTYPLPEAQLDRFLFKIQVDYPAVDELVRILDRTTGIAEPTAQAVASGEEILEMGALALNLPVASHLSDYVARLVFASHPNATEAPPEVRQYIRYGASPRGAQAILIGAKVNALLEGRFNVSFGDIEAVAAPALRHRLLLNFEGLAENIVPDAIVQALLRDTPKGI
ncbi:MAG: AAA family ATPase [Chloroflexi bacterium]|nr:AAA family ATPase [Chloroflexota bacterium]